VARRSDGIGATLAIVGGACTAAGAVLVYVRSRMKAER
jgi:hypothetical protein